MNALARHWLGVLNLLVAAFIGGALAAPGLAFLGWRSAADVLYSVYHLTCHQWAFRSFFLFGDQAVYGREQLEILGRDPFAFIGDSNLGWKLAFCERKSIHPKHYFFTEIAPYEEVKLTSEKFGTAKQYWLTK